MLLLRIVIAAAWMVGHLYLAIKISTHTESLSTAAKIAAWIPPLTPGLGWQAQFRIASVAWVLLAVAYLVVTVTSA